MDEHEELEAMQLRCAEAERAIEECNAAFDLIPIDSLRLGQTWIPSEVALHLLKKAKDSVVAFSNHHWRS